MNSPTLPAQGDAATVNGAAPADAVLLDPALAAAQPGQATPLAFLQFMQMDAVDPGAPLAQPELAGEVLADAPAVVEPADAEAQEDGTEAATAAEPLTAAMSMPMTPAMMLALPTAAPAAMPAAMHFGAGQRQERALDAVAAKATGGAAAGAVELPAAAALPQATQQVSEAAALGARAGAAVAQPTAAPQPAPAAAAPAVAAAAAPARESGDGQAAGNGGGNNGGGASHAGFGVTPPAAPNAAPREASTLALSGPPTAWRQSLQDALGERLNLQLGKNAEQAVIRLEPPMLGRVEISIRHAAGSLEVNITATHSEVLRQLNTVSDNLRSDLAQRQYLDVSVNVSQAAPRAQAAQAGSSFGADAQGRGRQQGQDQDERAPGAALAEANQSTTAFSLNGRA
ncbi:flagellar hook-length control protein FliK [Massilia sp. IC2-476]|uniref:flagellar hook-length control protein FliK n=1 Tax=Massilia sp. IC2-476 TaxID=2887199 RepID=UPI001D122717|nr:flagellar hook-length control protein FliK [Massilia sp. IC2-476]MCC2971758.1 flagellar hook-length control protein FliK [Massilia sp. IC2-476]